LAVGGLVVAAALEAPVVQEVAVVVAALGGLAVGQVAAAIPKLGVNR
jgi:hypothetical protein